MDLRTVIMKLLTTSQIKSFTWIQKAGLTITMSFIQIWSTKSFENINELKSLTAKHELSIRWAILRPGKAGNQVHFHRALNMKGRRFQSHAWANDFDRDTCDTYIKICVGWSSSVICKDVESFKSELNPITALHIQVSRAIISALSESKRIDGVWTFIFIQGLKR